MAKKSKKEGKDPTADGSGSPPLQTPVAGGVPGDSGAGVKGGSTLNLEDVPMSGRPSAGPTAGRLSTGAVSASGTASSIDTQKTKEIMGKVDRTKSIMEENIDAATQRGENLTELQQKTGTVHPIISLIIVFRGCSRTIKIIQQECPDGKEEFMVEKHEDDHMHRNHCVDRLGSWYYRNRFINEEVIRARVVNNSRK